MEKVFSSKMHNTPNRKISTKNPQKFVYNVSKTVQHFFAYSVIILTIQGLQITCHSLSLLTVQMTYT